MDQEKLREWEQRCTQEEPPECAAACPIHVDARLFVKEMSRGDLDAAFKVLSRTMPFPAILARICDHPCELKCKRGNLDAPIAISLLERHCVENAAVKVKSQLLPRRPQKIAIIGGALAGLTAAWDLLRKGFGVTLFERDNRIGGTLWDYPAQLLPPEIISEQLAALETMQAEIRLEQTLDRSVFEDICREYDAVFIDRESEQGCDLPLERDSRGNIRIDAASGATGREGVFAGGGTGKSGGYSPVNEVFQGRKGSLSIERFIQKANMLAGRENDGPFQTRLFTSLAGIAPLPRVAPADAAAGYTVDEARAEAGRCIQCECLECVKVCLYMDRYDGYPKKFARQIFNNEKVIYGAAHTKNQFVNSCTNCGLCETVCPNSFNMGDLCQQARRTMVEQKFMPLSFHEFALKDMQHSSGEQFALSRHEPGHAKSSWLYFPSCQLCATSPGEVLSSYAYLRERLAGGVGIMLGCCGAPASWAGRDDLFMENVDRLRAEWTGLGKPRVITACSSCQGIFRQHLSEIETVSIWKVLEENGLPLASCAASGTTVAVADPCVTRHDTETRTLVRRLLQSLGVAIEETGPDKDKPECCGYGGLVYNANPGLAREIVALRTSRTAQPGARYYRTSVSDNDYLAYCGMCRDNLASTGRRVSHLIEQLFPAAGGGDPMKRGWISWSQRRANRSRVRQGILAEFGERGESVEAYGSIRLKIAPDVRRRIDERRILEEDIRMVIEHAERTGKRLRNDSNGQYLACCPSENVTFWVDYTPEEGQFTVHNAYCHRMKIVGVKK